MQQLKLVGLFGIVAFLSACTTVSTQNYDLKLNQWLGKTQLELLNYWGAPDKVYKLGNQEFLSYYSQYNEDVPESTMNYQPFFINGLPDYDPVENFNYQIVPEVCKTTFTIEYNVVVAWSHKGSGCVAQ